MNTLKTHVKKIVRTDPNPTPWPRMILCAIATLLPLLLGYFNNQLSLCIYGGLTGYLLALNDHLGIVRHRIWVITLTFLILMLGFSSGFLLQGSDVLFQVVLGSLVYWLGVLGGEGAELERGVLFAVLAMIIAFFTKNIDSRSVIPIFIFCLSSYTCIIFAIPALQFFHRRNPDPFLKLRDSFKKSLSFQIEKHIYAAGYTFSALLAIWCAEYFSIERGYWIAITVLLVMRPDRTQSIYVSLQRLIGTALAVLICDLFLPEEFHPLLLISLIGLAAFLVPIGLKRNYLFASFFVTVLVLLLLDLAAQKHGQTTNAFFRLRATLIGCTISLVGTFLSKIISTVISHSHSKEPPHAS